MNLSTICDALPADVVSARLVEEIGETRREKQEERDGGEEDVEGDAARQKKNVVFPAVVPDALRVIAKRPADPGWERPRWALALFIRGLRFRDALLELDARLLRRGASGVDTRSSPGGA